MLLKNKQKILLLKKIPLKDKFEICPFHLANILNSELGKISFILSHERSNSFTSLWDFSSLHTAITS